MSLTNRRLRDGMQTGFRLFGHSSENHRDVVARVLVTRARDHDTVAIDFPIVARRLQGQCHFCPRRKCRGTAKFNTVFVDDYRPWRKNQTRLARFYGDVLLERSGFNFSGTHTSWIRLA